jgi:Ca-activated chloride channel homolog
MNLLNPIALWFGITLPLVVLFYLLKRRRTMHVVASSMLWQKFLADNQASAPLQRLRHHWLLVLQLIILGLCVLALARPFFRGQLSQSGLVVVIMDTSASMQSADVMPTRMEKAKQEALDLVNTMTDNDQMMILAAGHRTQVIQSASSEKKILRRAIRSVQSYDTSTFLLDAFKLASTLVEDQAYSEVHLFSDGATSDLLNMESSGINLKYHPIGLDGNNVGIVSMDVRPNPEVISTKALFAEIVNYSTNRHDLFLELQWNNLTIETRSLVLEPGSTAPQVFIAPQDEQGFFTLELDVQDDLAVDNRVSIVSPLPETLRTLLVTRGNRFLERALRANPNVTLGVVEQWNTNAPPADLVVLDNVTPDTWPSANTLAIHTTQTHWFPVTRTLKSPSIVDWKSNHPMMRFVELDDVTIGETLAVTTPKWAKPIVESTTTPLIVAGENKGQKVIWLGFDTLQSTWPLRISFPIFIANATDWLNPNTTQTAMVNVHTGDSFIINMETGDEPLEMSLPDGERVPLERLQASREVVFGDTLSGGIYKLTHGTNTFLFASNLMNASESDTRPRKVLNTPEKDTLTARNERRANLDTWRWLLALAFCFLMFEWWYYHKQTA